MARRKASVGLDGLAKSAFNYRRPFYFVSITLSQKAKLCSVRKPCDKKHRFVERHILYDKKAR